MKLSLLAILFFFCSFVHASADDSLTSKKKVYEQDLFINTTFFIKQIVSLSNSNIAISPYIVGYKCFFTKHHGIRVSVGGSLNHSKQFPDSTFVTITSTGTLNSRVGYEYRCKMGKLWSFFTGIDVLFD